jgi:4,5-dihydroxyphthalate decarboxylase
MLRCGNPSFAKTNGFAHHWNLIWQPPQEQFPAARLDSDRSEVTRLGRAPEQARTASDRGRSQTIGSTGRNWVLDRTASPVVLNSVLRHQPHTADLTEGRVAIDGVRLNPIDVQPAIAAYRRMVRDVEFDICELAPTTYYIARAYGAPFKALPIFLTRRFHHLGFAVRPDSGIETPKDLEGKKVGVRAYSVTTGVWSRGIFADEFGMDSSKVTWVVDDEEHVRELKLPSNVVHAPEGKSLASMMASGEIQAGFTANAGIGREGKPQPGWEAKQRVETTSYRELFPDGLERSADLYRRTGIYPFHGLVVVREAILDRHPWIAGAIFRAFNTAKLNWLAKLTSGEAQDKESREYRDFSAIVGDDPLPYGIEANRPTIEALIDYSLEQKLMPRRLSVDDLFVDTKA